MKKHYGDQDGLKVLSYNGIFTTILSNRNYGKTWTFKKRAFRRAIKKGKKTIWLRLFKKEKQEASSTFYSSVDLQKYCGISIYDKDTNPNGNLKQVGNTFYCRKSPKARWFWFLKVFCLSEVDALRSADDVNVDTIVFDEFTKPVSKYKRYRGNIATDFIDIWVSAKREHKVQCILIGNKESYNNPIFSYFGIKPLPTTYEGIKAFRKGSFVIQQINNVDTPKDEYQEKEKVLLEGTAYGNYIYKSKYKNEIGFRPRKTPSNASLYCQLCFNNNPVKISIYNGFFYVNNKIEITKPVYCDALINKFVNELLLVRRQKRFFIAFINALADNRVYYDSPTTYEAIQPFLQWLTL